MDFSEKANKDVAIRQRKKKIVIHRTIKILQRLLYAKHNNQLDDWFKENKNILEHLIFELKDNLL